MTLDRDPETAVPDLPLAGEALLPEPTDWNDLLTGTDGPDQWDRVVASEQARMRRYGGSVTIVLVEFTGFDGLASLIGGEAAIQSFARLSRVLARQVRASDHIARLTSNRFGILLIETDEVRTLNFVDRVLSACHREVAQHAMIQVAIGWASPGPGEGLSDAMMTADARLKADFFRTR